MKNKRFPAIILSALMALSVPATASAVFAAQPLEPTDTAVTASSGEQVTVEWSNENYPVTQNDQGEYIALRKDGTPAKFNGIQTQTTTTKHDDGTQTVEKVRYTFKNGKCTDVKTSTSTTTTGPASQAATDAAAQAANVDKTPESTKVTYNSDKFVLSDDGTQVINAKTGHPAKYNGLLIKTTVTTYTDGTTSTTHERYNFKDGVLQEK